MGDYRASFPGSKHLLDKVLEEGRSIDGYECDGYRSEKLYIHKGCATCEIRACVDKQEINHCGECKKIPCDKIEAFINDGHVHHLDILSNIYNIRAKGMEKWLEEQKEHWTCECGMPYSWYENTCKNCLCKLDSY